MMKPRLSFCFIALLLAALTIEPDLSAAQPVSIAVPDREAARICAEALVDVIREDNFTAPVKIVSHEELQNMRKVGTIRDLVPHAVISLDIRDETSITAIPFVFRDAPQFLAYLQSDLFEEIERRKSRERIALAYGGFTQLFSKTAVITEPQHLKGRAVAGDTRAGRVYFAFGAKYYNPLSTWAIPSVAGLTDDFERMERGHALSEIVEAPLADALASGAERTARFVSLTSSTLITIGFKDDSDREFIPRGRLKRWSRTAAMACSRTIYQTELDSLERLKNAGIKVAPFNRPPMIEASWRMALEEEHTYWTIGEFDRLIQLDGGINGVPLPSAIVAKLPAAKRRAALKFDEQARKELSQPWMQR
jgi:hypothetical protein